MALGGLDYAESPEKKLRFVKIMCKSNVPSGIEVIVARRGTSLVAPHRCVSVGQLRAMFDCFGASEVIVSICMTAR